MKNIYVVETLETCQVWKQYEVKAYTIEQAKDIVLRGDLYDQGSELDHYIAQDIEVNQIQSVKHCGTVEEV